MYVCVHVHACVGCACGVHAAFGMAFLCLGEYVCACVACACVCVCVCNGVVYVYVCVRVCLFLYVVVSWPGVGVSARVCRRFQDEINFSRCIPVYFRVWERVCARMSLVPMHVRTYAHQTPESATTITAAGIITHN